ncbi:hypothetical protein SISNIDRAFT_464701 [Sistotremastrum niveocremeum HHB9708]|uniref:Snf7-domain-containing protein n=1 Tax=Sistotremastrum niveocremeum HHB9708 TaxID=1314777 RepID=A0A164WGK6_9AGAM|nr:hypothetical protein SISNIDRAFT_464701 [Sistotremastrum niveocremeum HHB9708]
MDFDVSTISSVALVIVGSMGLGWVIARQSGRNSHDALRRCRMSLDQAMREITRELKRLNIQRRTLVKDFRAAHEQANEDLCRHYAVSLDQTIRALARCTKAQEIVKSLRGKLDGAKSTQAFLLSMTRAMSTLNRNVDMQTTNANLFSEFENQRDFLDSHDPDLAETLRAISSDMIDEELVPEDQVLERIRKELGLAAPRLKSGSPEDAIAHTSPEVQEPQLSMFDRLNALRSVPDH